MAATSGRLYGHYPDLATRGRGHRHSNFAGIFAAARGGWLKRVFFIDQTSGVHFIIQYTYGPVQYDCTPSAAARVHHHYINSNSPLFIHHSKFEISSSEVDTTPLVT